MRALSVLAAWLLLLPSALVAGDSRPAQERTEASWTVRVNEDEAEVDLRVSREGRHRGEMTLTLPPEEARRFRDASLIAAGAQVQSRFVREAGSFQLEGFLRGPRGAGRLVFTPDPSFRTAMAGLGYPELDADEVFALGALDAGPRWIGALGRAGYADLDLDQVMATATPTPTICWPCASTGSIGATWTRWPSRVFASRTSRTPSRSGSTGSPRVRPGSEGHGISASTGWTGCSG